MKKEKIIIASGYFDPLHVGHLEYFKLSKELGGKLIVILNNDEQCKLKKGFTFMPQEDKKKILEALKYVDEVFLSIDKEKRNDKEVPICESIKAVAQAHPNHEIIFAKSGDRVKNWSANDNSIKKIPEMQVCEEFGIKVIDGLGEKIRSSSGLIRRANKNEKGRTTKKIN